MKRKEIVDFQMKMKVQRFSRFIGMSFVFWNVDWKQWKIHVIVLPGNMQVLILVCQYVMDLIIATKTYYLILKSRINVTKNVPSIVI